MPSRHRFAKPESWPLQCSSIVIHTNMFIQKNKSSNLGFGSCSASQSFLLSVGCFGVGFIAMVYSHQSRVDHMDGALNSLV